MNKLSFGVSAVISGQRKASYEPELVALTTPGGFRITPAISKALGVQHGDYVAFVKNEDQVQKAVLDKAPAYVDWCKAAGYDPADDAAVAAFHAEYDFWGIVKGYQLFNEKGAPVMASERLSKEDRERIADENYDAMLEQALAEGSDELKAAIEEADGDKDVILPLLAQTVNIERPKYAGSKCANASGMLGTGVVLGFCDSNIWAQLTEGKDKKSSRSFGIDIDSLVRLEVYNGYENIEVSCLPFDPAVFSDKETARESASEE